MSGTQPVESGASTRSTYDVSGLASFRNWLGVVLVAFGSFVLVTAEFLPVGLLSEIAVDLGITKGQAGGLVAVPGLVAAISAPLATVVARNVDRRRLLVGLVLLIGISNVAVAAAPSLSIVLAGRVLLGVAVGGFWTFAAPLGRRLVPEQSGGRATTLIMTGISIGTVAGVPLGALLGHLAGWRAAFEIMAGLSLAVAITQAIVLPPLPADGRGGVRQLIGVLRIRMAIVGFAAAALVACGHFTAYTYLEPYLVTIPKVGVAGLSATLAAYGAAGILGTIVAERALAADLRLAFMGVAGLAGSAIAAAALLGHSPVAGIGLVVVWGAAFGAIPPAVQTWAYRAAPERYEAGSAVLVTVFQISLAAGSALGGAVVDNAGVATSFLVGGALFYAAALVLWTLGRVDPAAESIREAGRVD
ncbi:MFS transporter [Sphingomonas xinjiangensis]|uniref:Putative MFS family arabinose efflux permease n=1 Tax=Sphingomonas xinjiangensis TaxID=643568 RepID=A0A840YG72_9SPHN|nr:MFS transporter [Sphingomonas xinjiangensis]MBB5711834.1 putative MFS family arabinose efflux permease [Sphingomonas xinjiangensis]